MDLLYGRNPVLECLIASRRQHQQLWLQKNQDPTPVLERILRLADEQSIPITWQPKSELDARVANHQGVILATDAYPYADLREMLTAAERSGEPPFFLLLDQLQDPQNFGTLLRTAEATGVHGVLLPSRRSVGVTPAVVNASSGASEHLLIGQENLAQAIRVLKERELWLVGLEASEEAVRIDQVDLSGAIGLVVGSEGEGLRPLVRKSCDHLASLPMLGRVASLNAAVAGSIALFRIRETRGF
jgi:23S rRNA (guanosine2251-2'-O)-methyltransferase